MGARVFSLASVLNVLIVVLGNCEQITYESFSYMMTCEITISVGTLDALFVLLGAMVSKLFTNWTIYAHKVTFSFCSMSSASDSDSLSLKAKPQICPLDFYLMWTIKLILKDTCQDFPLALIYMHMDVLSYFMVKSYSINQLNDYVSLFSYSSSFASITKLLLILAVYASYCWLLKLANLLIFKPFLLCSWPGSLNIRFVRVGYLTITSQPTIEQQADSWNLVQKGFIALYANFDEEYLCLIPKSPVYLEGAGGELGNKLGQDVSLYI
ncbi:hypothetical protein CFP56_042448 [Quercus suber]|uniref:Uncharacterized protein n=1 Tax=Quercus suber TaxID=58331 RepID=A0AAW0ITY5_QUESU